MRKLEAVGPAYQYKSTSQNLLIRARGTVLRSRSGEGGEEGAHQTAGLDACFGGEI